MRDFLHKRKLIKLSIRKTVAEINKLKKPKVAIDQALDKYRDIIMFPEKLAKANDILKTAKLPENQHGCINDFRKGKVEE